MAKQLGMIRLLISGIESGPTTARFEYIVSSTDDPNLTKCASLEIASPDFGTGTLADFFNSYVALIKTNEGIS